MYSVIPHVCVYDIGGPTSTTASTTASSIAVPTATAGIHTAAAGTGTSAAATNNALLQAFIPMHHSESSYLTTLDKVDEAIKDPAGMCYTHHAHVPCTYCTIV